MSRAGVAGRALLVSAALAVASVAPAQEQPEGWTALFNGRGKVNLVLTNPRQPAAGGLAPLTRGRFQIQSEGAEVYYRNIAVRRITEFPDGYRP
jgi:hypothetical protein